jgi:hypothetical protein
MTKITLMEALEGLSDAIGPQPPWLWFTAGMFVILLLMGLIGLLSKKR